VPTPRSARWLFALALLALAVYPLTRGADQATPAKTDSLPPPVQLTAEQDHQRIMDLLHITSLRRGADGDPQSPYAANYDESKANPYPNLPYLLRLKSGKKSTPAYTCFN